MSMDAEYIATRLKKAKKSSNGWMACCPAHDDKEPSLSISNSSGGKVLVYCHAGCSQDDVITALRELGLWPSKNKYTHPIKVTHKPHPIETLQMHKLPPEAQSTALTPQQQFDQAHEADPKHPYLELKQIPPLGIKQSGNTLLIPMQDNSGRIVNIESIYQNDMGEFEKRPITGVPRSGCFHVIGTLTRRLWIVEGYATGVSVHLAIDECVIVAFGVSNLSAVIQNIQELYDNSEIIIAGDNDHAKKNNVGKIKAAEIARAMGVRFIVPSFSNDSKGSDFNDLATEQGLDEAKRQLLAFYEKNKLLCCDIDEFLSMRLMPREHIIAPWFPTQGLAMVYATRGLGKTYFALTLAIAIAGGGSCFGWLAPKPRGVLYLDGEMPAIAMQERLSGLIAEQTTKISAALKLITRDLNPCKRFTLADTEGQQEIEKHLEGIEVIIVDNISTLCSVKENDADAWLPVQEWVLKMRARGISVLFIHHANKSGTARGTSKREDILDTVILLRRPNDYNPKDGAVFEVHFEKSRGFTGDDAKSIQVTLAAKDGTLSWHTESVEESTFQKIVALHNEGLSPAEISEELEVHKSTISRNLKKARDEGLTKK